MGSQIENNATKMNTALMKYLFYSFIDFTIISYDFIYSA